MSNNAVELVNISKQFSDSQGQVVDAVKNISLAIQEGEFFSLLGPSGCGKTTTLRMIAGFEVPSNGTIYIHGEAVEQVEPYQRRVNTVFQNYALFPHMTIFDNVAFGLEMEKVSKTEIRQRVEETLNLVQLPGMEKRKPRQLSGGQQQRVALARALVKRPDVLLLDEPLGALDLKLRKAMQFELKEIQDRVGITFIYVTHDQEEALTMSDRIAVMNEGDILQIGTPADIYEQPSNRFVADFIGETNLIEGTVEAVEADKVTVKLATGTILTAATFPPNLTPGQAVMFALRPEKIVVSAEPQDNFVTIQGTVADSVYIGTDTRYIIRIDEQNEIVARSQNTGLVTSPSPEKGRTAYISWQAGTAQILTE
ncbi:MAG: ABC transporter ATP-binding protein [Chloroflexota bacterium]